MKYIHPHLSEEHNEKMFSICRKIQNSLLNATGILHIAEIESGVNEDKPLFYISVDVSPPICEEYCGQIDGLMASMGFLKLPRSKRPTAIFKCVPEQIAYCDLCGEESPRENLILFKSVKIISLVEQNKLPMPFNVITSIMDKHNFSRIISENYFLSVVKSGTIDGLDWMLCCKCVSSINSIDKGD